MRKKKIKKNKAADEIITELYQGEPKDKSAKLERPVRVPLIKILFITVIFGLLAGITGELFMSQYFSNECFTPPEEFYWFSPTYKEGSSRSKVNLEEERIKLASELKTSFVEIYEKNKADDEDDVLDKLYLSAGRLSQGVILTSDGWILTMAPAIGNLDAEEIVVTFDSHVYDAEALVVDSLTDVVFIKIDADNLPAVEFIEKDDLNETQEVLVFENKASVLTTFIKGLNVKLFASEDGFESLDYLTSSEEFSKFIVIQDKVGKNSFGAPVFNLEGELIGITNGLENNEQVVVPMDYLRGAIGNVLKAEDIKRPYLGVNYIDLAFASGVDDLNKKGALLYDEEVTKRGRKVIETSAVIEDSPADEAGLEAGDLIIKVNSEEVDQRNSLTQLIQEYQVGDEIELTYLRDGEEASVSVKLVVQE